MIDALVKTGFRRRDTIVALQKVDLSVPDPGNPEVTVRQATHSDFAAILEIDRIAFDVLWWNTAATLAQWLSESAYFVVAEWNRRIVGYQCASLNGRHAHLSRIAVHPRYHGQHIGVRLLAEAMAFFQRERVFGVTLNTQQDNDAGRRLYEWFGFRVLGEEAQVLVMDV
jgi:ribosomal protein S18 acetylase RimI-like enzyme